MSPATATDSAVFVAKASDSLANKAVYKAIILGDQPIGYWRLDDVGNVAADSSGNGHAGAISGYADLVKSKGANLVAYWRLEETVGTNVADSSGNNRNGTLSGAVGLGVVGPLLDPDLAMSFDGLTGKITVPFAAALNPANFTAEAWIYLAADPGTTAVIFDNRNATFIDGFALLVASGLHLASRLGNGAGSLVLQQVGSFTAAAWHHVAYTYDGASVRLYVDGVLVAGPTAQAYVANPGQALVIGEANNSTAFFPGNLDEIAIYNSVLTAAELLAHYQAGIVTRPVIRGVAGATGDGNAAMLFSNAGKGLTHAPGVGLGIPYSMEAWFKASSLAAGQYVVCGSHQGTNTTGLFINGNGSVQMRVSDAGAIHDLVSPAIGLFVVGNWYHIVGTYDGANVRIYLNGALVAGPTAFAAVAADGDFYIAGRGSGFTLNFDGNIDESAIYNATLTAAQILNHYTAGLQKIGALATATDRAA